MDRIDELIKILKVASHEYYNLDNPSISDQEYDRYLKELILLEEKYPELIRDDSPTKNVGTTVISQFEKVVHNVAMLSLGNSFNNEEIISFDEKIKKENIKPNYYCEYKIDGLSVSLIYENGKLVRGATRGNGNIGEDITHNVLTIKTIPKVLKEKIDIEVRGEIYMSNESFEQLNINQEKNNLPLFANPRNAAAGSIRQLDSKVSASRNLDCILYQIVNPKKYNLLKHSDSIDYLSKLGFNVNKNNRLCKDIFKVIDYIDEITLIREKIDFAIDGIVIKVDDFKQQEKLGFTVKYPKWATAYKFKSQVANTKLKDIIFSVGRTGQVTPNAVLEPVLLMGSVISKTTLHNADYVYKLGLKIGDTVTLIKAGDVIPEVTGFVKEKRTGNEIEFKMATHCPICNSLLEQKDTVAYFCMNENCEARIIESLVHFVSRNAYNIEGLGERIIEEFYNLGYIKNYIDIFNLKNHVLDLKELDGFGEKSINNLLLEIENSKSNSLEKLLFALGIRFVGAKTASLLAFNFKSIEVLKNKEINDLLEIKDIGEQIANSVYNYFRNEDNLNMLKELNNLGLNFNFIEKEIKINNNFLNKIFVLTGSLEVNREKATLLIESFGGKVTNSISKKTDVLIAGLNAGSKIDKAKNLNITIWNEIEFLDRLEG
ncbi:MAG: NAD-dependent DNA ligase LigA [Mycoplasmatota bacterium]